ncbi:hypothetical protein An02g03500 [Aspergillus niger]|uniref:Uncharacterized protein n=2 Tax=Aspergillus niger TaxID=5061 RepID=A2QCG6_ASPNC|nr:hypothetical protein An02g03500 [Aspergillus niger]CAK47630.1 hypothetical protein An02g03500 [Aspergillus niger]
MAVEIRMSASSSMRWSALDRSADGLQRSVCASFPITASVDRGLDPIAWQAYQIASKLKNHSRPGCQGLLCKWVEAVDSTASHYIGTRWGRPKSQSKHVRIGNLHEHGRVMIQYRHDLQEPLSVPVRYCPPIALPAEAIRVTPNDDGYWHQILGLGEESPSIIQTLHPQPITPTGDLSHSLRVWQTKPNPPPRSMQSQSHTNSACATD